jgi:phage protein D
MRASGCLNLDWAKGVEFDHFGIRCCVFKIVVMGNVEVQLTYNGKDISVDVSNGLIGFDYTDKVSGESDDLSVKLEDVLGLWKNEWYMEKGAELKAKIVVGGLKILDCGTFEVDEVDVFGSRNDGDYITIKALGAGIKQGIRTIKNSAHQNKTLREIAVSIANKFGYTVQGVIPNIKIGYMVQHRETDLHFLQRIANDYGLQFSVRGTTLVFTSIFDLENAKPILTFGKSDLISYNIKDKTSHVYLAAESTHYVPRAKKVVKQKSNKQSASFSSEYLNIFTKAENDQQAELKARAALYKANTREQEGSIEIVGNVEAVSGMNIQVNELGMFAGIYHITQSRHRCDRDGGYVTDCEIKRVGVVAKELAKQRDAPIP